MSFPAEALQRLAGLVLEGDVVFFIGAGFSLDSEKASGSRLVARLLIRLLSLCQPLGEAGARIREDLQSTFDLAMPNPPPPNPPRFPYTDAHIKKLAERYYETNDWFCSAFGELLKLAVREFGQQASRWFDAVCAEEKGIRETPGGDRKGALDDVPLDDELLPNLLEWVRDIVDDGPEADRSLIRAAGKALFLDTMGFRNSLIMGGDPCAGTLEQVSAAYRNKLLPRHHIIARLAREGLCTTTVTPNFDLLLEGAYRLAGFRDRTLGPANPLPPTMFSDYVRITSPAEFFSEGKAHRTAVLVKMHGCARTYRDVKPNGSNEREWREALRDYLRSMVFTYREIQNWREDSWAADFLRTLLRTRTVVFAGYSLQDPVVHDTFRTVYEEMARIRRPLARVHRLVAKQRELSRPDAPRDPTPADAPAFFFGLSGTQKPFHGLEVLHAATDAAGIPRPKFGEHPNYVRFFRRTQPNFPNLDEVFQWLFHLVIRLRQQECLETDLQRTLTALHGRPRPDSELGRVRRRFRGLLRLECAEAKRWERSSHYAESRRHFARICAWSESFHTGLLREFGAVDILRRRGGPGTHLARIRRFAWYYPAMQDAGWTCWSVVVELALRRMVAALWKHRCSPATRETGRTLESLRASKAAENSSGQNEKLWAAACDVPTVLFQSPCQAGTKEVAPHAVQIQLGGFESAAATRMHGHPVRCCIWHLRENDAPWRPTAWRRLRNQRGLEKDEIADASSEPTLVRRMGVCVRRAPPAYLLWRWAAGTESDEDLSAVARWLGEEIA